MHYSRYIHHFSITTPSYPNSPANFVIFSARFFSSHKNFFSPFYLRPVTSLRKLLYVSLLLSLPCVRGGAEPARRRGCRLPKKTTGTVFCLTAAMHVLHHLRWSDGEPSPCLIFSRVEINETNAPITPVGGETVKKRSAQPWPPLTREPRGNPVL